MFNQINGMIGFTRNLEAQREIIGEYVRNVVQQLEDVQVGVCISVV